MRQLTIAVVALILAAIPTLTATQAQEAHVDVMLATDATVLGQPITYPTSAPARVTAATVTVPPGGATGWHRHDIPLFAYIIEGTLTVDYEGAGKRIYRPGDALVEAIGTPHNGRNLTRQPVRILAVFIGAADIPNTVAAN